MMLERLRAAAGQGALRLADVHFARRLERLAGRPDDWLLLAAALVSGRVGEGDVCLDLAECRLLPVFAHPAVAGRIQAPPAPLWAETLRGSPVVGAPGAQAPLILDAAGRLYLARYWQFEQDLAAALGSRVGGWMPQVDRNRLRDGLTRLFPSPPAGVVDWQRVAAAMAVLRTFCVICGGPGTGKTRTVAAVLALLVEQAGQRPVRLGLAAPTGKAAARLAESIRAERARLALGPPLAARLPEGAGTLHRLLGFRPGRAEPRHGPDDPLDLDALVVDEASMVDLPLMSRLLAALPATARLVLLGDRDQLASVEPGRVLGDIAGRGPERGYSPTLCAALEEAGAACLQPGAAAPSGCADHVVVLRHNWRFGANSGIGALAAAINRGDASGCEAVLRDPRQTDVAQRLPDEQALDETVRELCLPAHREVMAAAEPAAALAALDQVRVLAAVRHGPWGVEALNWRIEQALTAAGLIERPGALYAGRPIMVTENDHRQGLYNGDVGLLLPDPDSGVLRAWFAGSDGVRRLLPARLPPHETVYAMTVHKSQGSEAQQVVLVLPPAPNRAATRELVYTAVTRARRRALLLATPAVLGAAVKRSLARTTGLSAALWGAPAGPADAGEPGTRSGPRPVNAG